MRSAFLFGAGLNRSYFVQNTLATQIAIKMNARILKKVNEVAESAPIKREGKPNSINMNTTSRIALMVRAMK